VFEHKLLYFTSMSFPNKKAHSIQIINTCHALSKYTKVILFIKNLSCPEEEVYDTISDSYGLQFNNNFQINTLPPKYQRGILFPLYLHSIRNLLPGSICYTRSYRLANRLIRYRSLYKYKVFFESHKKNGYYKEDSVNNDSKYSKERNKYEKTNEPVRLISKIYKNSDKVFFLHDHSKNIIEKDFPNINAETLWYGINKQYKVNIESKSINFCYCGSLSKNKLLDFLVDSVYLSNKGFVIDVFGGTDSEVTYWKNFCRKMEVSECFNFKGYFSHKELIKKLSKYKYGITTMEGIKVIDYILSGVVPIIPSIPSFRDIFYKNKVYYYEPDCPESLARILDYTSQAEYFNIGYSELIDEYSLDNRARKILNIKD